MVEANVCVMLWSDSSKFVHLMLLDKKWRNKTGVITRVEKDVSKKRLLLVVEKFIPPGHNLHVIRKPNDSIVKTAHLESSKSATPLAFRRYIILFN